MKKSVPTFENKVGQKPGKSGFLRVFVIFGC